MKSVEVAVKPIIKVTMESDSQNLDEVVVVGYGTQRKKDVTSAISKYLQTSIVIDKSTFS